MVEANKGIRVFVYGSLKSGFGNHGVLNGAFKLGDASIKGNYKMLDLGYFPGVVRTAADVEAEIHGEVYLVDEDGLDSLDCLEGHPSFYCREKVATEYKNAWVYFLPQDYDDGTKKHVVDGVWTEQ